MEDGSKDAFSRLSSFSSSQALVYLDNSDHTSTEKHSQGFDFSAQDVLSGYDFHASSQPRRRTSSVENISSRRHRLSDSPVCLTRELISARKHAEQDYLSSKIISAVDYTIKKNADNILQVLEGMSNRLSHLESVSQVVENSVASLKASVDGYNEEADARLKALNSHVMEMHQAVQILRDKQDIVETTAELAKLQASKAEVVCEKATKQPVVSSQIVIQEQINVVSNLAPKRDSAEVQVSGQSQFSKSADVSARPQQLIGMQEEHTLQPIQQSLSRALCHPESSSTFQPSESTQSVPGALQAQAQYAQIQQSVPPHQGSCQAQPLEVQVQQSLPSQQAAFQGFFQAQQQQFYDRQSVLSQEGASQAQQQHVWAEQTLPFQQGASQNQAYHVQAQQGYEAPQGEVHMQPQHVQMQQSAQSQGGAFQSQQQTQQCAQSEQGVIQAQVQQQGKAAQQSFQPYQGLPQPQQWMIQSQSQQAQAKQSFQLHQNSSLRPSMGAKAKISAQALQTQQNPNAHIPLQGAALRQGSFQFTQQNESFAHAPGSQAAVMHPPYITGPSYEVSNTRSFQQHPISRQPIRPAALSNLYHRSPSSLESSQLVYASQMERPAVSLATITAGALPIAQNVYDQNLSRRPENHMSREDEIVEKVASMGFLRDEAWSVIKNLANQGQIVDTNVVLDSLMNKRNQFQRGGQAR